MKTIRETGARSLTWTLAKDTYELRAGAEVVATLRWQKGSLFLGEVALARWTFKRSGFLRPKVMVREENSSTDLATLSFSGSGGRVDFPDGRTCVWTASRGEWSWNNSAGELLVQVQSAGTVNPSTVSHSGEVQLAPAALVQPDLSLLILLSWYVLVLQARDITEGQALMAAVFCPLQFCGREPLLPPIDHLCRRVL